MKKIIDNKRVEITQDEYELYLRICENSTEQNREGKELFVDHFEVNEHGIITFVKTPENRHTTMEVYFFLTSLMQNQHLRIMHNQVAMFIQEATEKVAVLLNENKKLKEENSKLKDKK